MKLKNLSSVILAAMMAATSVPAASLIAPYNSLSAYAVETAEPEAEAPIASGLCGENLTWEVFAEEDSLVIDGTGAMTEWKNAEDAPWAEYGDRISLIVIRENVESVSENAFGATGGRIFYFDGFDCVIPDSETFLPENASIHGYDGSTAQAYAEKYGREFSSLGKSEGSAGEGNSSVVEGDRVVASGICGENLKWEIDSLEDSLIISGYGEMTDWEKPEDAPWFEYSDEFDIVIIRPGVGELSENSLGSNAKVIYLTSYNCVIPDSETVIPADAIILGYAGSTAQAYAEKYGREFETLSEGNDEYPLMEGVCTEFLEWILWDDGSLAFYGFGDIVAENGVYPWDTVADSIKEITISTAVRSIGENAFTNCTNLESVLMYTPDCKIADSTDVFPSNVLLQVGDGSTAEEYAVKYNLTHVVYNFFTASGEIGDNLTWVLFNGGSLRIYGEGDMIDLGGVSPWAEYEDEITRVQINHEVTSVDEAAFEGCDNIAEMIVLNPECKFAESEDAIPEDTVIYAAEGSSALMYAQLFGRSFKTLSSEITAPEEEESYIAYGELGENLTWKLLDDGVIQIDGEGAMDNWASADDVPWAEYRDQIKRIRAPKEVKNVGDYAFYDCVNLEYAFCATIIGEHAYENCKNITNYYLYEEPIEIKDYAFYGCDKLNRVTIHNSSCVIADSEYVFPAGAIIEGYAGSTAQAYAEKYGLDFVEIESVEQGFIAYGELGENLTWSLHNDGKIYINGVGEMPEYEAGNYPWSDYSDKIKYISLAKEVTSIGAYAFYNCTNLIDVGLEDCINIGEHAFEGCENLSYIFIWGNENTIEIGDYAFYGCDALENVFLRGDSFNIADSPNVFPEGVIIEGRCDGAKAYAEKYNIEYDDLSTKAEGNLTDTASWIIYNNNDLNIWGKGIIPDSDGYNPWSEYADDIKNIFINSDIVYIGDYAFYNCKNAETIEYYGVYSTEAHVIGNHAFDGCEKLKEFIAFYEFVEIGDYAFYNCDSMEDIFIYNPECVIADSEFVFPANTVIHGYAGSTAQAYAEKYGLEFVEIEYEEVYEGTCGEAINWSFDESNGYLWLRGEGVMNNWASADIVPWAEYADKITNISIDGWIESIGDYAFSGLTNLRSVQTEGTADKLTRIGEHAFDGCINVNSVGYYSDISVNEIGDYAFNNCGFSSYTITNPDCVIADSEYVFPAGAIIKGYAGSTAQAYAEKYGLDFVDIAGDEQGFIAYGELGENLTWKLLDDGVLQIDGEGEMLECGEGGYPWSEYADMIKSISLAKEVTSIGAYAFYNCINLESIELAPVIGEHAYDGCINVNFVGSYSDIPVNEIGDYAFNNCGFFSYQFTNPDCVIADSEYVFPAGAIIEGYAGSTAQAYAEKYNRQFEEVPKIALGDVNEDGQVNSSDASIVLAEYAAAQIGNTSSFTENQTKAADVNGDGVVNSADASEILRYYSEASTGKEAVWNLV